MSHGIVRRINLWMPAFVLAVFCAWLILALAARGQDVPDAFRNSIAIAGLQRQVSDLGDVPTQIMVMRERLMAVETIQKEQGRKLDSISDMEALIAFGVLGLLGTFIFNQVVRGKRMGLREDSGVHRI